ncbi:SDR family NAD(P)-dependent oxidoreductase [Chloroflexota bacterium]
MGVLDGKVAVVTGSPRGLGKAIVKVFCQEGASCVANSAFSAEVLNQTVDEIKAEGGKVTGVLADVRDPKDTDRLMAAAVDTFGKLDILVNNAAVIQAAFLHKMTDEQWDRSIDTELKGAFNCVRSAAKYMRQPGHNGRIVNISAMSILGQFAGINYAAAKSGLIGLAYTVAWEFYPFGVTCNNIAFGEIESRIQGVREEQDEWIYGEKVGVPKEAKGPRDPSLPNRLMKPEEAARVVLFFAGPDSWPFTGQTVLCTHGMDFYLPVRQPEMDPAKW